MGHWASALPVVTLRTLPSPTWVTLVYPYYENAAFLAQQIAGWAAYPEDLKAHVSAVIVDDGSPVPATLPASLPFPIRLFRIDQDVRWNWLAARNIGAHHADEGWLLLTDMDHVVPEETLRAIVFGALDPATVYAFSRVEHTGAPANPHSASWLMTKQMFWRVGGYDERFSGYYGTDGIYRRRLMALAPVQLLTHRLERHEYQSDASTTRYRRKQPGDQVISAIFRSLPVGSVPKTLSFKYHEVTA